MKLQTALAILLITAAPAWSGSRPTISRSELVQALNQAGGRGVAPVRPGRRISARDVRKLSCSGAEEEPTEFECAWLEREGDRWVKRRTWMAIDASGWHVIG